MIENRIACIDFTLGEEGGFVNDPRDPGGATYEGVTLKVLRTVIPAATIATLRKLTRPFLQAFYTRLYWRAVQGDNLPPGVDLMVFDLGVTSGPRTSLRLLQDAVGFAGDDVDGVLGGKTLGAVHRAEPRMLVAALAGHQQAYCRALPEAAIYGRGWSARTQRRAAKATILASQPTPAAVAA